MNPVERLLQQEVTYFVDRLASSVPPDGVTSHVLTPAVRTRLDEAEAQLAQARASLMEGYGRWRRALEDVENLWAVAAWRSTAAEEASEHPAPLAACRRGRGPEPPAERFGTLPVGREWPRAGG